MAFHSALNGSLPFHLRASYRGLAMSPKLGIQILQNPAIPKNPSNRLLAVGTATLANASLRSSNKGSFPFDNSNPRYFTVG